MSLRFKDASELPAHLRDQLQPAATLPAKPSKYRNEPIHVDGIRFDSRLEADRYQELRMLWDVGVLRWFTRQVPFRLQGGVVYRADFMIVWAEGPFSRVTVEDCKGLLLQEAINKLKQVHEAYGFVVDLVTREEGRLVVRPWRSL